MVIIINKILKQILKIADKEKIEIMSIRPIFKEMKEMEAFLELFQNLCDDCFLDLDMVYITFIEDGAYVLFPIVKNKILEESILKVDVEQIDKMLEQYYEMEEKEENEEIELFN